MDIIVTELEHLKRQTTRRENGRWSTFFKEGRRMGEELEQACSLVNSRHAKLKEELDEAGIPTELRYNWISNEREFEQNL